ncbi:SDR family NAD(P)-dependent oxidoreductase [Streptomyces sp. A012304]|uniref:SDR family NAD(P)-dependent oxidoreductase n=1 Tax=Streptomyces sp. A012304 TaxID=375446 RepID=UPI00222F9B8A|nr:SDR family NAD(P)-dependent oxidoreductase [Streptomyces sp. A012304]GKQ39198.1 3-oxoacyl-ACP reductase [Streptomyces sp. A012304]
MATPSTPRTAVITGAGSRRGIGRATAHALAVAGYHIAVLDLDKEAAEDTAREVAARHGVEALGLAADITEPDAVDAAIGEIEAALPPIGALVNNAGITSPTRFLDVAPAEWDRIFEVNVRGSFLVTHRVAAGMAERGFGRIVFLSSVSAERGGGVFGGVAYSAAKAALLGFARALARELGPSGITVNSVAPGLIDTDITQGKLDEERKAAMIADVPVRRIGEVEDVADVIAFLARPEAGYLTGVTYDVNGGSHMH